MSPESSRRSLALGLDIFLVFLTIALILHPHLQDLKSAATVYVMLLMGKAQLLPWKYFVILFALAPLPHFLCRLLLSASPGQYANHIREVDENAYPLNPLQAFLHSYLFLPSIVFLNGLPQIVSLLDREGRTLIQILAHTQSRSLKVTHHKKRLFRKEIGILLVIFSLYSTWKTSNYILHHSKVYHRGLVVGGTAEDRENYFKQSAETEQETQNDSPEDCFNRVREALDSRDAKALINEVLTAEKLAIATGFKDGIDFDELPSHIEWIRTEGDPASGKVQVIYHERGFDNEQSITLIKEMGSWKVDATSMIKK